MLKKFLQHLKKHKSTNKQHTHLLAVSGGVDSVVLTHLYKYHNLPFAIAHCHFGLRQKAADNEAQFVHNLAKQYNVHCHLKKFATHTFAQKNKHSIQMAARQLRYTWFEELCVQYGYSNIITAHHHNDQIETTLFNLIKGTGLRGLQGIPSTQGRILRPLLFATKKELYVHAKQHNLTWHEDQSNQALAYRRNWIRHKIIPLFDHVNPNSEKTFFTTFKKLQQTQAFFDEHAQLLKQQIWRSDTQYHYIHHQPLHSKPWAATLLAQWLEPFGFDFHAIQQWCQAPPQAGKKLSSATHWLLADRKHWILGQSTTPDHTIYTLNAPHSSITIPNQYTIKLELKKTAGNLKATNTTYTLVDADKLTFPLWTRRWQAGDTFCPLGMQGKHKKLSDFFIDKKIPRHQKEQTYVLGSHEHIIWVIDHRIDHRFRLTTSTKQALQLSIHPCKKQF